MISRHPAAAVSLSVALVSVARIALCTSASAADWPVFDQNPARTGVAAGDTALSARNVATLHRRWTTALGAVADSTPIFLAHVPSPHGGSRAMLFQTARTGTSYGIDAADGRIIWRFVTHGPQITTSTPAADPSGRYVYVPAVDGLVHKLGAATGIEVRGAGFPVRITRMPEVEKAASALNLANGQLYAVTSGYFGDFGSYHGHLVTVRLRDGTTHVFNTLCSGLPELLIASSCPEVRSGVWARAGAVVDPDPTMHGRVYLATGNGPFTGSRGDRDYGDSVLAVSGDGTRLEGSFTPADADELERSDTDLGSTAPALLPRDARSRTPLMAVQGGKDGIVRLLDRAHLGGGEDGMLQAVRTGAALFSAPAVWQAWDGVTWVYLGTASRLLALRLVTDARGVSRLQRGWESPVGGTSPVVSNGIVIAATDGALNALDARTGQMLWSSTRPSAGGSIGAIHWESPVAVNGWVYISDEARHLTAYAVAGR